MGRQWHGTSSLSFAEVDASWASRFIDDELNPRQAFLSVWIRDRLLIGLRLFWRKRGTNCFWALMAFCSAWLLGLAQPSNPMDPIYSSVMALCVFLHGLHWLLSLSTQCLLGVLDVLDWPMPKWSRVAGRLCTLVSESEQWKHLTAILVLSVYLVFSAFLGTILGFSLRSGSQTFAGHFNQASALSSLGGLYCSCFQWVDFDFLWAGLEFDSSLGYPGEGPCSLCGDTSHEARACTFVPGVVGSSSSSSSTDPPVVRNTAVHLEQPVTHRDRANNRRRCYCPVPGCVSGDPDNSPGWPSVSCMRPHLEEHSCGRLDGDIPRDWLDAHGFTHCAVCSRLVSSRFGRVCPRCRPTAQYSFDSTLGFPGEGPCSLCGDTSHNARTCPYVPDDAGSTSSRSITDLPVVRNTFVHFEQPVSERARNLRGHSSEGDATSTPPSQLRRINEEGGAVPGSLRLEDAEMQDGSQDSVLAHQASSHLSMNDQAASTTSGGVAGNGSHVQPVVDESAPNPGRSSRVYCPVPGCLCSDPVRAPGWTSVSNMRSHLGEHTSGRLAGDIPVDWLEHHNLGQCTVCSRLLSRRYGSACPRCRPQAMQQPSDVSFGGRPVPTDWPSADSVASKRGPSKRHIPKGARKLWATCLLSALAAVAAYNDVRAWTDLLCLPKLVLAADSRGGRKHQLRIEANTKQKCQRWLEGDRNSLWQQYQNQKINRGDVSTDVTESRKHGRVDELLQESLMQQACNALGKAPPVSISSDILAELQSKHPPARQLDLARLRTLRGVSPAAAT